MHVLELKRDRSPRDVVAQLLDYGSWINALKRDRILDIAAGHFKETPFEAAFADAFGVSLPDEINGEHHLTIVAAELDPASERIVHYLSGFDVPINAVFFSFLRDGDREYLARGWLIDPSDTAPATPTGTRRGKKAEWSGHDWYVSFGDGLGRSWLDGRRYGFVSSGGGNWYSRTLRNVPVGDRVFVCLPQGVGYVAVGRTTGPAMPFAEAFVTVNGRQVRLPDQELNATYSHEPRSGEDTTEYVIPVEWVRAEPKENAFWEKGMFANQNSACKFRDEFTLTRLREHFGLDD